MFIRRETIFFLMFVLMGMVFSVVFDFFRAIRSIKKSNTRIVTLQDIVYFFIIAIILIFTVINIPAETFRLYLIIAIGIGIVLYTIILKNKVKNIFVKIIKISGEFNEFVFLPLKIHYTFLKKVYKKVKKYVKCCCKKNIYMVEFNHKKVKIGKTRGNLHKDTKEGSVLKK